MKLNKTKVFLAGGILLLLRINFSMYQSYFSKEQLKSIGAPKRIRILAWTDYFGRKIPAQQEFKISLLECKEQFNIHCEITDNRSLIQESHAILFHSRSIKTDDIPQHRNQWQPWIHMNRESPPHEGAKVTTHFPQIVFNWTMSYRRHSDVYHPYGRIVPRKQSTQNFQENLFSTRPKLVAWVSSNCNPSSKRITLVKKLQKYIPVDIFGRCGNFSCETGLADYPDSCMPQISKEYKFYLALENSYCYDYVTEKSFNALNYSVVPIVFGYGPYGNVLPPNAYINVESFKSVKELADYILYLASDREKYEAYLKWTSDYKIHFGNGMCNMCRRLAGVSKGKWYSENPNTFENIPELEKKSKFFGLMEEIGYQNNLSGMKFQADCIIV